MRKSVLHKGSLRSAGVLGLLVGGLGLFVVSPVVGQEEIPLAPPIPPETVSEESEEQDSVEIPALDEEYGCPECVECVECDDGCGWCNLGEPFKLADHLCSHRCQGEDPLIDIGGWTQWGYHTESNGLFNSHDSRFNNHQSWLYAEKVADGECGLDWGFRADLMYGVDAQDTQAFGEPAPMDHFDNPWDHGIYGWALPQLYAEVAYGDLSVIAGHFYTLVGYEVVTAPDNFFYSHAYTMFNSEPFTHSGALATYKVNENVEAYGGWVAGWDTGFERFSDGDQSKGSAFLGGASLTLTENATLTYITTVGDLGTRGEGYSHSVVLDLNIYDNLNYVLQSDLVETNGGGDHQYSVNQYLFYTLNDCLAAGGRFEWWKNGSHSQYAATAGINYRPLANVVIRPEVRHDWNPSGVRFNGDGKDDFTTFGVDAILTF